MDATSLFPSRNLMWYAKLSKTMLLASKWPNWTTRFDPGPSTYQFVSSIFVTMWKRGLSLLSMSHQNINSPIFLPNHCPVINTSTYAIRSWGGCPLHLLNTRECEVIVGTTSNCLPTSVPVLPILLRAILYFLQYLYLFPPIVCLFYLTRCLHPYLLLSSIQPGVLFTYDYPSPPQYTIKFFVVNSIT